MIYSDSKIEAEFKKSLKFFWKMCILRMWSLVTLVLQDINLTPGKCLFLLNVRYMWNFNGLDLLIRYLLTEFSYWPCAVFTLLRLELSLLLDLSSHKDVLPFLQQSKVIYKFQCGMLTILAGLLSIWRYDLVNTYQDICVSGLKH